MTEITIPANDARKVTVATGGETNIPFDFPIFEKSHLVILRTRASVTTTLVLDTDYTIATNQLEVQAGGNAVLAGGASPATAADIYTAYREVPESRLTDYAQAGSFKAATINRDIDLAIMIAQQHRRDLDRKFGFANETVGSGVSLAVPAPTANYLLRWNAAGTALENYSLAGLSSTAIAAALVAFVQAATLPAAMDILDQTAEVDVASAASCAIGAAASRKVRITGTTTITSFGTIAAGTWRIGRFAGILTLTHHATSLILPGAASITTAAGDRFVAFSHGSGNWEVVAFQRADGTAVVAAGLPAGHIAGLVPSNAADTAHDITITAGKTRDATDAVDMVLASAITKQIDAAWAVGNNAGGLDTGAAANNTWYAIWLIKRSDTGVVDPLFSTSFTAPTMPTNYNYKRLIGANKTNGSASFYQFVANETPGGGLSIDWGTFFLDVDTSSPSATRTNTTITVPPKVVKAHLMGGGTTITSLVSNPGVADQTPVRTTALGQIGYEYASASFGLMDFWCYTNSSGQVAVDSDGALGVMKLYCLGYEDARRV